MISAYNIEELASSHFIQECQCDSCTSFKGAFYPGPKTLVYRIWNTNFYICFFQMKDGTWEAFYSRGDCPYQNSIRSYLSFEEVFDSLPEEGREVAIYHLNILS
jgi:hypothetical protein